MADIKDGDIADFRPQSINANKHTQRGEGMLETSMHDVGFVAPITVAADGEAFDGSSRLEKVATVFKDIQPLVVEHDGTRPIVMKRIDIPTASHPKAVKASVYANRVAEVSLAWDTEILEEWNDEGVLNVDELWFPDEMEGWGKEFEPEDSEEGLTAGGGENQSASGNLRDRFIIPPFSVLDARQGYWQERKRQWLALGIQSELGRGGMTYADHEWQIKQLGKVRAPH